MGFHIYAHHKSNYYEITNGVISKSNLILSYAGHRNYCVEADLVVMRVVSQVQDRNAFE